MRTILRLHASIAFFVSFILCVPVSGNSSSPIQQNTQKDTLKSRSSPRYVPRKDSTFKLLPRFNPQKDTAGFQLIPPGLNTEGSVEVVPDIYINPYDKEPQIVKKVEPTYPEAGRRAGLEGKVVVRMLVDEKGKVKQVIVAKSDAEVFNEPAIEAARQFVVIPATKNKQPVQAWLAYEFHFRLHTNK